jgi:hypothetical protein
MADVQTASLYEQDFYLWALDQVRAVHALRDAAAGRGDLSSALTAIDWDNVIEELEGLATGVRSELRRRMGPIIEHLVKLELSTATDPRRGWEETIQRSRYEIEFLLDDNPSLRREVAPILLASVFAKMASNVVTDLVRRGEIPGGTPVPSYTPNQILGDWRPGEPEPSP